MQRSTCQRRVPKPIRILGQNLPAGVVKAQTYATMVYDGTAWNIVNLFCPDARSPRIWWIALPVSGRIDLPSRAVLRLTRRASWGNIDGTTPAASAFAYNWGGNGRTYSRWSTATR